MNVRRGGGEGVRPLSLESFFCGREEIYPYCALCFMGIPGLGVGGCISISLGSTHSPTVHVRSKFGDGEDSRHMEMRPRATWI